MDRVAILGLGLMGGSLGLALKKGGFSGTVAGYARRAESGEEALSLEVCDEVYDHPGEAVRDADLTVACVPIRAISDMLSLCRDDFKEGSIVTDVGSTKAELVERADALLGDRNVFFVGSHPIAGSEQAGMQAARADLYDGALVVLTPGAGVAPGAVERLSDFWRELGMNVQVMEAEEHDRLMARTSHLPHVTAALLAAVVSRKVGLDGAGALCGTGFADATRIAGGSPTVWRDIMETNAKNVVEEMKVLEEELIALRKMLEEKDFQGVEDYLEKCREGREVLLKHEKALNRGGNS